MTLPLPLDVGALRAHGVMWYAPDPIAYQHALFVIWIDGVSVGVWK